MAATDNINPAIFQMLEQIQRLQSDIKSYTVQLGNTSDPAAKSAIATLLAQSTAQFEMLFNTCKKAQGPMADMVKEFIDINENAGDLVDKLKIRQEAEDELLKMEKDRINQWRNNKTAWGRMQNKGASMSGGQLSGYGAGALGVASELTKLADAAADIYTLGLQKSLNTYKANADVVLNQMETNGRIFQRHMKTFGAGMQGALSSTFASITQGVQEGAYSAATSSVDFANQAFSQTLDDNLDKLKMQQYEALRMSQLALENLKATNQQWKTGLNAVTGIVGAFSGVGGAIGGIITSMASTYMKVAEAQKDVEVQKLEYFQKLNEKQMEIYNDALKTISQQAAQDVKEVLGFAKEIENVVTKTDASARQVGVQMGFNAKQMAGYENAFFKAAKNLTFVGRDGKTHYLDKDNEDMMKMQSAYIESSGRNIQMDNADFVKMSLLGKLTGDDNLAAALLGDMDIFNKTIADSTDLINDMFTAANKAGVSNRKFAKDLQQNLKLAQKYNFKNGVKGVMEMSIWAQKTRISMQSVDNVMESLQKGGLEGAIEKSARLQVLGGRFAMGSNPLAMLSDAFSSPESMAERMKSMISGMGSFNKRTGEINFGVADQMQIRAYTDAMGLDYVETMNAARQNIKNKQIDHELRNQAYTEEQKALLYSKAQYDQKTGSWRIKYTDKNGQEVTKGVNELGAADFEALMPVEEQIEKKVSDIYDLLAEQKGATNFQSAFLAELVKDSTFAEIKQRVHDNVTDVQKMSDEYKQLVETSNKFMTEQNQQQHKKMAAITNVLEDEFKLIKKQNNEAIGNFYDEASKFNVGLKTLNAMMEMWEAESAYNRLTDEQKQDPNNEIVKRYNEAVAKHKGLSDQFSEAAHINTDATQAQESANIGAAIQNTVFSRGAENALSEYASAKDDNAKKKALNTFFKDWEWFHDSFQTNLAEKNIVVKNMSDEEKMKLVDEIINDYLSNPDEMRKRGGARYFNKETGKWAYVNNNTAVTYRTTGGTGGAPVTNDALSFANGSPMAISASNVTPINDGQIAMTHPMDTGIFAKTGGPFDTLFNKIFDRINAVYDFIRPSFVEPAFIKETKVVITKSISEMKDVLNSTNEAKSKPVEVNINGSIELKSGGQGIDIIGLLKNNPDFVRKITEMVAYQISSNTNGGKSEMFPKRFTW